MSFQSLAFLAFLTAVVALHQALPARLRTAWIVAACLAFYASYSVPATAGLVGVTLAVYAAVRAMGQKEGESAQFRFVIGAVSALVGFLGVFKYGPTVAQTLGRDVHSGGLSALVAPLGISYYVFKLISYVLDVYWERAPAARDPLTFLAYVAFFPAIVSGPIQRSGDFIAQLEVGRPASPAQLSAGLRRMLLGYFKKVVLADTLGATIDPIFSNPHGYSGVLLACAAYLFALQLYADFSGLTDIAIGAGRLLGIEAPENFQAPFFANNIQEFWRRWHMTLSSFLTDYLFTPLQHALRRWGKPGLWAALMANMLSIGLWHGPRLTFVAFGAINGLFMIGSVATLKERNRYLKRHAGLSRANRLVGPLVTFHMMAFALVFFRAENIPKATYILSQAGLGLASALSTQGRADVQSLIGLRLLVVFAGLALVEVVEYLRRSGRAETFFFARPRWLQWSAYYAMALAVIFFGHHESRTFIYAQF